jgi:choline kinase
MDSEAMKVELRGTRLVHMSKWLPPGRSAGESMGVFLIRENRILRAMSTGLAEKPHASLDDAVNIACGRMVVTVVFTADLPWEEIDNGEDMNRAVELFG